MAARFEDSLQRVPAVVDLLEQHHLVSLFGLRGSGKSALCHAVIRRLGSDRFAAWTPQGGVTRSADFVFVDDAEQLDAPGLAELARASATGTSHWLVASRSRLGIGDETSFAVGRLPEQDAVRMLHTFLVRRRCTASLADCHALVNVIDSLPGQLLAAARFVELHGVQYVARNWDALDPLTAPLSEELSTAGAPGLDGAACFLDQFDAAAFVAVTGASSEDLAEMVDRGYVERIEADPPGFRMLRSVRRVAHRPPVAVQQRHHKWVVDHGARVDLLDLATRRGSSDQVDDDIFSATVERLCEGPLPPASIVEAAIEVATGERLAALLSARSRMALRDGDPMSAEAFCDEAAKHVETGRSRVVVHGLRAQIARVSAAPANALREYEDALALGEVSEDVLLEHAATLWESGEHRAARRATREALARARAAGDLRREGIVTSNLGVMAHHAGELGEARELHQSALAIHVDAGNRRFEAIAQFDLGTLDHELGILHRALRHYARAVELLIDARDHRLAELARAATEAARAQLAKPAVWSVDKIERDFAMVGDAIFTEAAGLYRQLVEALCGEASAVFDFSPYQRRPDEVQLPARLLADLTSAQADNRLLLTSRSVDRFVLGEVEVDLSGREALRNVFRLFVRTRLESGDPVSLEDVISHGWPGEEVTEEAAKNRAHVTLSTLRRLGLRDVLETVDHGYRLMTPVCVVHMSTGPTASSS